MGNALDLLRRPSRLKTQRPEQQRDPHAEVELRKLDGATIQCLDLSLPKP